jgi:signal transduction histidine kinase
VNNALVSQKTLAERLERLLAESTVLTRETSLEGVLQRVTDLARELIGARYAAFGVLSPDHVTLEAFYSSGLDPATSDWIEALPTGKGVLGVLIRDTKPLRLARLDNHPASSGFPPDHPPMQSFLGVPVMGRVAVLGNLYLTDRIQAAEFSEEDEHLAVLLAQQAAAAIENARLHEESARLIAEVQQLHRTRERFFAMVNHELRNALAAVYGWAEILVRRKEGQPPPSRAAYEVLDSASAAAALISDLLDLSRLDEDRLHPVMREVHCRTLLDQAAARVLPELEAKALTIRTIVTTDLTHCRTDASRVMQILLNLLRNAARHSPAGGQIRLNAHLEGNRVVILVGDSGPGIPPEMIEHVFDVYQTDAGEERSGVGLGLPLSRRLARLLGGELSAESRPEGGGNLRLELPYTAP